MLDVSEVRETEINNLSETPFVDIRRRHEMMFSEYIEKY